MTILNKPNCLNRGFFSLLIEAIRAIDYSVTKSSNQLPKRSKNNQINHIIEKFSNSFINQSFLHAHKKPSTVRAHDYR